MDWSSASKTQMPSPVAHRRHASSGVIHISKMMRKSGLHAIALCTILLVAQGGIIGGLRSILSPIRRPNAKLAPNKADGPQPPLAERRSFQWVTSWPRRVHVRPDPYSWLRDDNRKDPDVLKYLEAENGYTEAIMSDTKQLQAQLFGEIWGRVPEEDQTVPERVGDYFYYTRTAEGEQYRIHCRRKIPQGLGPPSELDVMDESIPEEILLDENAEAKSHAYYKLKDFRVSPNQKLIMYAEDTTGDEVYTMHVQEISTGKELLMSPITGTKSAMFAPDTKTIFYTTVGLSHLANKVWRHKLGTSTKEDKLIFHEKDEAFALGDIWRSLDDKYMFFQSITPISSETYYLDASNPDAEWKVLFKRQPYTGCTPYHRDGYFYMRVWDNDRPNEEVVVAPVSDPENQRVLIPHEEDVNTLHLIVSKNFMTLLQTREGLPIATVYRLPSDGSAPKHLSAGEELEFDETAYTLQLVPPVDFSSDILRVVYTSLTTPTMAIDYNMATGNRAVKKVLAVLGGFSSSDYQTERVWATASDSTRVPISLVYRKDVVKLDGSDPLLLTAYGSFGVSSDPSFSAARLPLLDRGLVYAIAHVRGGGEVGGRYWHTGGKLLNKKNTFTDLVACAEELIAQKFSSPDKLSLYGGSAGGTAVAAAANVRPDLFHVVIAAVPFVDALTSLLDASVPLTRSGWAEWGNPLWSRVYYDYIESWSPYDNIEANDYPHTLVTAGLNDPRVPYWEPAKYTARMRATKTDDHLLIFKCDMESGHSSKSGRFDLTKEFAFQSAFLLKTLKMAEPPQEAIVIY